MLALHSSAKLICYRCLLHNRTTVTSTSVQPAPFSASPLPLPTSMRAWTIQAYNEPLVQNEIPVPKLTRDDQVLLRVMAASINPIDIRICEGYGRELLMLQARMGWNEGTMPDPRRLMSALTSQTTSPSADERFPLITGRDCSAEVVQIGSRVQGIEIGDQVIAVVPPEWQGTHADYVVASAFALAPKPTSLDHNEAASFPYVACTAWSALITAARIQPDNAAGLRVLIHGGAGGVGTVAIQMLKCWGAERVVATCSKEKLNLVEQLGANAVDYKAADAKDQLIALGPYEVILDCVDSELSAWSDELLGTWRNCIHVSLNSPLLADTDRYGLAMGSATFGAKMLCKNLHKPLRKGQLHLPAFFRPSQPCLQWVSLAAADGRLRPVIDQVFPFAELPKAFEKVAALRGKGKTVVDFTP